MMKVIIGYDGSPSAEAALADLHRAGLPADTKILIVTVGDNWTAPAEMASLPAAALTSRRLTATMAQLQNQAERTIKQAEETSDAAARIKSKFPAWQVGTEIMCGDAGWAIIQKAAEWRADLIVVGTQNRSAIGRFFLGSVSQRIVVEADCSVRVARYEGEGATTIGENVPHRIVAGIDDSEAMDLIVETIARRNWTPGTEVTLLTGSGAFNGYEFPVSRRLEEFRRAQKTALARLLAAGMKATTVVKSGDARVELLAEAEKRNADTIFVGTRDIRGTLDRLFIGSVSASVAANAACSVEVMRARADV